MDKFKEIRPIVLGIVKRDGKLLVGEGYDKVKDQTFYRCLGGGIEFLEKSSEALKREFKEELDIDIKVKDLIYVSENIFTYKGKKAHEIVFYYDIEIKEEDYREEYHILDQDQSNLVKWVDIEEFKNKNKILYPEEIIKNI